MRRDKYELCVKLWKADGYFYQSIVFRVCRVPLSASCVNVVNTSYIYVYSSRMTIYGHLRTTLIKGPENCTGWQRLTGCLKLQVIFRKRATNWRALLRKMTYKDKASYGSSPPCMTKVHNKSHLLFPFKYPCVILNYVAYTMHNIHAYENLFRSFFPQNVSIKIFTEQFHVHAYTALVEGLAHFLEKGINIRFSVEFLLK